MICTRKETPLQRLLSDRVDLEDLQRGLVPVLDDQLRVLPCDQLDILGLIVEEVAIGRLDLLHNIPAGLQVLYQIGAVCPGGHILVLLRAVLGDPQYRTGDTGAGLLVHLAEQQVGLLEVIDDKGLELSSQVQQKGEIIENLKGSLKA